MKNVKTIAVSVITSAVISFGAVAGETKEVGTGPNPFTDCGIGAALFPDTHWAAVTSNVIWDIGTTAVTSATASPETCNAKSVKAAAFIYESYNNLAEETAKGNGEHLAALMNILETEESNREAIINEVRSGLASLVSSPEYVKLDQVQKASAFYNLVNDVVGSV